MWRIYIFLGRDSIYVSKWFGYDDFSFMQDKCTPSVEAGCSELEKETLNMTSTDTYQLKWHSHSSHLNGSVASLLRSERFTDVVLCTMDGSQIPAHKFILSSCSVYFSNLFEGQRSVTRMGGILYVVLPSEISTKALKILVEYMYKGETTVSNEVLDIVLKAGEVLKIRGLWRQTDEIGGDSTPAEKTTTSPSSAKQTEKTKEVSKIALKKDDKILKTFNPIQGQGGRPMFIGPPKLVFIKTSDGTTQAAIRPGVPGTKGQTILVTPAPANTETTTSTITMPTPTISLAIDDAEEGIPARVVKRNVAEKKYGKKQKVEPLEEIKDDDAGSVTSKKSSQSNSAVEVHVKEEPEWDASSIEEEERSIAEMFQAEMSVKSEPCDDVDVEEEGLLYSPLSCELCAEVFSVPAAWVRHVQHHADNDHHHARKRKRQSDSDDTEETTALLRCDLCQKHFPNPAEWVRHVQSSHTETELALSNNSEPPKRHNRFTDGEQNKKCEQCNKMFPSHASMLIHLRTHTVSEMCEDITKRNARNCKKYRLRKKSANPNQRVVIKKTNSEKCRQYRQRKKLLAQQVQSNNEAIYIPSNSSLQMTLEPQLITTGERPFVCGLCNKGFNVKSNLLRHLRTLHDQVVSPTQLDEAGPSELKKET
ncbi:zinc finger and BTB domain-containing protein 17 isoform X6 [Pieris rapae]|uniref:zinc finger and BTB domain-containing protein 17 isoform X6 n=1 Tax=Pieris rapae TaxID=64459 RepID=UPI001E27F0DC|nr:zinc finger and BTB domain-containing protein 17 isoform X6 [Pieris rapae]